MSLIDAVCRNDIEFIISHISEVSQDGIMRALQLALQGQLGDIALVLASHYRDHSQIMPFAVKHGNLQLVQRLVAGGVSWSDTDVVLAAAGGHRDVVEWCAGQRRLPRNQACALSNALHKGGLKLNLSELVE